MKQIFINQIRGPFKAEENLWSKMVYAPNKGFIGYPSHLGVVAPAYHFITIDGVRMEISQLETLDLNQLQVMHTICFNQDEGADVYIDYIIPHYEV